MLYLQKGQNLQKTLQQVSCFFLDIPKHAALYMFMYAQLLWFKI